MRDPLSGLIDLDRSCHTHLTRQLYDQLRAVIVSGRVSPGQRLPSGRVLATRLKISRNTVSAAIDQLATEGYLDRSRGRRPVVVGGLATSVIAEATAGPRRAVAPLRLSKWAQRVRRSSWPFMGEGEPRPFLPGLADRREFPHETWARCLRHAARSMRTRRVATHNRPALQEALIGHLTEHRGVRGTARQLVITPSAQAAIELVARVMLNPGDIAWLESPGYGGARVALEAAGARVMGVCLDTSGLTFAGRTDRPRLIFVTPSHQYPTGCLMPITRRLELLRFAASVGAVIVEDDYDSEFHYEGRPVAALQGLDASGHVVYIGTFAKSMLADIRVGYTLVPDHLVDTFERAQRHTGHLVPGPLQDALAAFIGDGLYGAHIRRVTRLYGARRDRLVHTLASEAAGVLLIDPPAGGMQLLARYLQQLDDRTLSARLASADLTVRPLSVHFTGQATERGLFLGFAAWNEQELDAGARTIGRVVRRALG